MAEDEAPPTSGATSTALSRASMRGPKPEDRAAAAVGEAPVGDMHSYIGSRLRKAFDDIASQPVPDRFLQLMEELDRP